MAPQTSRNGRGLRVKSWMGVDGGRFPPLTTVIQCQRAEGVKKKRENWETAKVDVNNARQSGSIVWTRTDWGSTLHNPTVLEHKSPTLRILEKLWAPRAFISKSSCEPKPRISKVLSAILHLCCKKHRSGDTGWYFISRTFTRAEFAASLTDRNLCCDTTCTWTGRVSQKHPRFTLSPRTFFLFLPVLLCFRENLLNLRISGTILPAFCLFASFCAPML